MDMQIAIKKLAEDTKGHIDVIATEEATKNALIMPFLNALGYNVFNPSEVVPEFVVDVGIKKGEKVDYAIKKDGQISILIECKPSGAELRLEHASQLYRYFSVTDAKFAILTNGVLYKFYTDIDQPNRMDSAPFFEFNLLHYDERDIEQLKKFSKDTFDVENIVSTASNLKYMNAIQDILTKELAEPSEDLVRHFAGQVYSGRMTQAVKEQFTKLVKEALNQFIRDRVKSRLSQALASESTTVAEDSSIADEVETLIDTTQEELDGFNIVRAILCETVSLDRVVMRDTQSYCGVLLDDNNRKPICRLHFNGGKKYLGLFENKAEERVLLASLNEIYNYANKLKAVVAEYDNKAA